MPSLDKMTSQKRQPTPSNPKGNECVLLIASDADAAARVLGELGSVTEERFEVEWVSLGTKHKGGRLQQRKMLRQSFSKHALKHMFCLAPH